MAGIGNVKVTIWESARVEEREGEKERTVKKWKRVKKKTKQK